MKQQQQKDTAFLANTFHCEHSELHNNNNNNLSVHIHKKMTPLAVWWSHSQM